MSEKSKETFDKALKLNPGEQILLEFHTRGELESFRVQLSRDKVTCRTLLGELADEVIIRKNTRTGHQLLILEKLPILPVITVKTDKPATVHKDTDKDRQRKLMRADGLSPEEIEDALKE